MINQRTRLTSRLVCRSPEAPFAQLAARSLFTPRFGQTALFLAGIGDMRRSQVGADRAPDAPRSWRLRRARLALPEALVE